MSTTEKGGSSSKVIDSHLRVWASPTEGLNQHFSEIEELCTVYPSTIVADYIFVFASQRYRGKSSFLKPRGAIKIPTVACETALFRVSREPFPYRDISSSLSQLVSSYGANRIMWGSDFPFIVPECGYEAAKNAACVIAKAANLSSSELKYILGGTVMKLFPGRWASSLA